MLQILYKAFFDWSISKIFSSDWSIKCSRLMKHL